MRCQCCKSAAATVQLRDVEDWEVGEFVVICESCAKLVLSQFAQGAKALPSSQEAVEAAREALEEISHELDTKTEGAVAKVSDKLFKSVPPCPSCGMTFKEFQKIGRLGCEKCYDAFGEPLATLIGRIHGDIKPEHKGRRAMAPALDSRSIARQTIHEKKQQMLAAVKAEKYEHAAQLRDEITKLETGLK